MRERSIYTVECICGHVIVSETPDTVCPGCKRTIRMEWRTAGRASEEPRTISERYEKP